MDTPDNPTTAEPQQLLEIKRARLTIPVLWLVALCLAAIIGGALGGLIVAHDPPELKVRCTTSVELVETSRIETTECGPA